MDLKNMLLSEKVVSFDFPGCKGLKFNLAYLSKESNQALIKKCQTTKFNTKSRQAEQEFDDELFLELYVRAIVKGWNGFKLKFLKTLVLVDVAEDDEENELDFSDDNALNLMKNSVLFDTWVSDVIGDLGNFTSSGLTSKSKE